MLFICSWQAPEGARTAFSMKHALIYVLGSEYPNRAARLQYFVHRLGRAHAAVLCIDEGKRASGKPFAPTSKAITRPASSCPSNSFEFAG